MIVSKPQLERVLHIIATGNLRRSTYAQNYLRKIYCGNSKCISSMKKLSQDVEIEKFEEDEE